MTLTEKAADKIVNLIADGRMDEPMIQSVAFWIAHYTVGTETENRMLTLASAIQDNIREVRENHDQFRWS